MGLGCRTGDGGVYGHGGKRESGWVEDPHLVKDSWLFLDLALRALRFRLFSGVWGLGVGFGVEGLESCF